MRDGIALAAAGHPTIVFVHDAFQLAARNLARVLGMENLKIYAYPQPTRAGAGSDDAHAAIAAEGIVELLKQ